ncbi:MAG: hypothetical protein JXR10_02285 [Cyclobacteriaceae bacterium]
MNKATIIIASMILLVGCKSSDKSSVKEETGEPTNVVEYNNPPAEGFNYQNSTPHAIVMADQIMNAMGGRKKWDETNVLYWNFFGVRTLLWDKKNNRVRIDWPNKDLIIALNMDDMTGKVWRSGEEMVSQDSINKYLKQGKNIWINDSYWLVMPFKLKDTGVSLTYVGEIPTLTGVRADVLRLNFEDVGNTPQNAYEIWVDIETRLIEQWAYYKDATQEEPNFVRPWTNYQDYDGLLLASERGDRDITDIKVMIKAPKDAFETSEPIKF